MTGRVDIVWRIVEKTAKKLKFIYYETCRYLNIDIKCRLKFTTIVEKTRSKSLSYSNFHRIQNGRP